MTRVSVEDVMPALGNELLAEYLVDAIPQVARTKYRQYKGIPVEDLEQALWIEVMKRPEKYRMWASERPGLVYLQLLRAADVEIKRDRRHEYAVKALQGGYSTDDIEFYSTGLLSLILQALFAADMEVDTAMQNASAGTDAAGVHINSSDPFGGAENYQAMLIDVAAAFNRLSAGQRRLLRAYYGVDQEDTQDGRWERQKLASSMGLTAEALRQQAFRALRRLQGELGGESPWR